MILSRYLQGSFLQLGVHLHMKKTRIFKENMGLNSKKSHAYDKISY